MLLVFVPLPTFFIYGPLFLVAFILGIVAIAQKRLGSGLGLLLATIIGSPVAVLIAWTIGILTISSMAKADLDAQRESRAAGSNTVSQGFALRALERAGQRAKQIQQTNDLKIMQLKAKMGDTNTAAWLRAAATNR